MVRLRFNDSKLSADEREELQYCMKMCDVLEIFLEDINPLPILHRFAEWGEQVARRAGLTEDQLKQVAVALRRRKGRGRKVWVFGDQRIPALVLKALQESKDFRDAADLDRAMRAVGLYWLLKVFRERKQKAPRPPEAQTPQAPAGPARPPEAQAGPARTPAPPAGPGEAGKT